MITPNPEFRLNANRAVYLHGEIDQQLINRLTPEIISLQNQSREPITVFIDSPGGRVDLKETLLQLLKASNQDFAEPCHLITVVTSRAASAAADLLSSGDYAIAYPESTVLYHGVRMPGDRALTAEITSFLAEMLRLRNDRYAMDLARTIEFRFMYRFVTSRGQFQAIRDGSPKELTDLECFLEFISEKLSDSAIKVLENAQLRYKRYEALLESVLKKKSRAKGIQTPAEIEAFRLKAIVEFELRNNKNDADWSFQSGGLHRVTDDFFLLYEYLTTSHSKRLQRWCGIYGKFLLARAELDEINREPEPDRPQKTTERVLPLLQPVGILCRPLSCVAARRKRLNRARRFLVRARG